MRFTKPALTLDEQVELLVGRGMGGEKERIFRRVEAVNYYRLAAYWHTFRVEGTDAFRPGTHIDTVWDRYLFDRRLRLLTLDALERFEITARTRIAHELAVQYGPFGYVEDGLLFAKQPEHWTKFNAQLRKEVERSGEEFLQHFRKHYGDHHALPPIWVAIEIMAFGSVVTLYQGAPKPVRDNVASFFGVPAIVVESWLRCLNVVRNICAHHARLWNRTLGVRPMLPRATRYPDWHKPVAIKNDQIFAALTILAYTLNRVAPRSGWGQRLETLFRDHPDIHLSALGFPDDWRNCPIWTARLAVANTEFKP